MPGMDTTMTDIDSEWSFPREGEAVSEEAAVVEAVEAGDLQPGGVSTESR